VPAEIPNDLVPLPETLRQSVRQYADRTALVFMNRRMSYRELGHDIDVLASALAELGVERGTKVAIQLPNLPQTVIAYHAVMSLGANVVMTNPLYVERELEHQWHDAECRVAVVADYLFDRRIRRVRDKLPVEHYVVTGIPDYLRFPLNYLAAFKLRRADPPTRASVAPGPGVHLMRDLMRKQHKPRPIVSVDSDDLGVLQYTGGTTGVSKGAMLTHGNLACNVEQVRESSKPQPTSLQTVSPTASPLYSILIQVTSSLAMIPFHSHTQPAMLPVYFPPKFPVELPSRGHC
jgi:long-chain acyl-CoA synthetase